MRLRKIKYKIAIPVIAIIICLGILVFFIDHLRTTKIGVNNYKLMGESILRNSEKHIAHHLYLNEIVELQKISDNIKKNEHDITYVFIVNNRNHILAHTFTNGFPKGLLDFNMNSSSTKIERIEYGDHFVYDFSFPIENGHLGIIRMGMSGEQLDSDLSQHIFYLISLFLGFIIIGIIISWLISGKITRSIDILLESVNKIAYGDFAERVKIKSKDEIEDLATAVNFMADSLQVIKEELEEKIVTLESKNQEIELINIDIQLAKNKAEESDRLKTEFLNNISHEIRTPMNAISGFTELLLKPSIGDEQKIRYISIINSSTHNLLDIINDIIIISEINSGVVEKIEENFDISELIEKVKKKYEVVAIDKKIKLKTLCNTPLPSSIVREDYGKLEKILDCLVSNAIKFTKEGEVEISYSLKDKFLEFKVNDTGLGIEIEKQKDVFEYFKKVKNDPDKFYEGTGLGLAIAKAYVQLLGGNISFNSEPNIGSEFCFSVPAKFIMEKNNFKDINDHIESNEEDILLIVEDEMMNYLYLVELLENVNAKIVHAKSGKEAITSFNQYKNIKLILLDIKLPDINGYELSKQFKATKPNIPIIAQTAYAMQGDKNKAIKAGCDDYIAKPIIIGEFHKKVAKFVKLNE